MNEEKTFYIVIEKIAIRLRSLQVILGKDRYER